MNSANGVHETFSPHRFRVLSLQGPERIHVNKFLHYIYDMSYLRHPARRDDDAHDDRGRGGRESDRDGDEPPPWLNCRMKPESGTLVK